MSPKHFSRQSNKLINKDIENNVNYWFLLRRDISLFKLYVGPDKITFN